MAPATSPRYTPFLLVQLLSTIMVTSETLIKETHMTFYLQDWVTGKNVTALPVAGRNKTSKPTDFDTIVVIDDAVTAGPKRSSPQVRRRAQGTYVNSMMDGTDVHLFFSNIFTNAEYNGSTLEIQGADRFSLNQREVSVVSGTGAFRFVRGYVVLTTVFFRNLNAVVQCNVTIRHY
ncbi:hypothetical protein MRB53_026554 [Persea americana]|uniref:Uncharacterized protein n=1 Tax=Persea americana TaxID=3435 RepID=A0ACC2LIP3_PERAE|nr:hypothetical protein MRB53_026554 [Persea americana]